ncbi:MAG: DUF1805 domain-containing protein [Candidatus Micrarchaeota archaeon]
MQEVEFCGRKYFAFQQTLGNLPMVVVKAKKGYIACSYINRETAEKVGDVAAFVAGVKNVNDLLSAKVKCTTSWAEDLGIREGMSVRKALELMDREEG